MAYWPGNVRHYQHHPPSHDEDAVEFICRFCMRPFHTQGMLESHETKCPAQTPGEEEETTLTTLRTLKPEEKLQPPTSTTSPQKNFMTLKPGVAVKTVVVGSGGKVVKKIILRAPASATANMPNFPPLHTCPTCRRTFARSDHLQMHMDAFHGCSSVNVEVDDVNDSAEVGDIDVITAESPEKPPLPLDPSNTSINWEEVSNKKVNYPIALKKIPIGKRTGGKFWRVPTLKSGLPLVLKVVGGSGMEELSESMKPLFCSVCRFLFKTPKEMRAHVVSTHIESPKDLAIIQEAEDEDETEETDDVDVPQDSADKYESRSRGKRKAGESSKGSEPNVDIVEGEETPPSKFKFQCEECDAEFKSHENIVEHLRKVHRQRMMHQCTKCDKFFSAKNKLSRHEQVHLKMETGPSAYECDYCGKQFVYESYLRRHRASHTGEKFYTCSVCGENFRSQGRLVMHKATAHEGGGGVASLYQCDRCGKTFPYKSYLDRHVKTHISDIPKSCPHCNQVFKVESSLQKHIYKEHEGRGLLPCPHCDKKFLYPSYLERHQSVHTANREHQCPMCNKRFSLRGTLLDHLKSHLPSSDDVLPKSSTCMICNNKYRHEANLERHMQQMHPREWVDSLYEEVPDARFEETVETAEEEDVRVEFIDPDDYPNTA